MKKFIYNIVALLALTGAYTSCTEDLSESEKARQIQAMSDITSNSDVEISLAATSTSSAEATTRGSIEPNDNGFFETKLPFGVFLLANTCFDPTLTKLDADNIDWRGSVGYNAATKTTDASFNGIKIWDQSFPNNWSVWEPINNIETDARYNIIGKDTVGTTMKWHDGGVYYYPYGSPYAYSFYAYHPRTQHINRFKDVVFAKLENLDGTKDVIWGCAKNNNLDQAEESTPYAYSAKYFHFAQNRVSQDSAKVVPMHLYHVLARLKFFITPGGLKSAKDSTYSYELAKQVTVDSISIFNAPEYINLIVASHNAKYSEGTFPQRDAKEGEITLVGPRTKELKLYTNEDAAENLKRYIGVNPETKMVNGIETPYAKPIPGDIMVPPLTVLEADTTDYYYLQLYITVKKENNYHTQMVVPMKLKFNNTDGKNEGLKSGYTYNVNLTIFKPEKIYLTATLEPWKMGSSTTFKTDDDGTIKVE